MRKSIHVAAKGDDPSRSSTFSFSAVRTDQSINVLMGSPGGLQGPTTIPFPVAPVSSAYMSSKRCDGGWGECSQEEDGGSNMAG